MQLPVTVTVTPPAKIKKPARKSRHPLAPVGRPAAVIATPALVKAACESVRLGMSYEGALALQGVSRQAMARWLDKNPAVALAFSQAQHEGEQELLQLVRLHAIKDPKPAQWLLERTGKDGRFVLAGRMELTGKDGGPIQNLTISKTLLASVAQGADMPRPMKTVTPQGS